MIPGRRKRDAVVTSQTVIKTQLTIKVRAGKIKTAGLKRLK